MDIEAINQLRIDAETARFSARRPWADQPIEFSAVANKVENWHSGDFVNPDAEGMVSFQEGGSLFIQTQLLEQERFVLDVRLEPPVPLPYEEVLRVRFSAFGNQDQTMTAQLNIESNLYTLVSPFATWPDSVELYIDSIDPVSGDPSRPGFNLIYCDLTKVTAP